MIEEIEMARTALDRLEEIIEDGADKHAVREVTKAIQMLMESVAHSAGAMYLIPDEPEEEISEEDFEELDEAEYEDIEGDLCELEDSDEAEE